MRTRTGNFAIGWRRGGGEWQQDLGKLLEWAKSHELEVIDLLRDGDQHGRTVLDAGLQIGAVDLPEWQGMISADRGKRAEAIARSIGSKAVPSQCSTTGRAASASTASYTWRYSRGVEAAAARCRLARTTQRPPRSSTNASCSR